MKAGCCDAIRVLHQGSGERRDLLVTGAVKPRSGRGFIVILLQTISIAE